MAQSIGDLAIKLGFDVDDAKLQSFNTSIKDVFSNLLQIAGISATAAGMYELAKGAAETQVQWRNFNAEIGGSIKGLQQFAALWATVNPFSNVQQGQQIATNLVTYANKMLFGQGGKEYGYFGGTAQDFLNPKTGQFDPDYAIPNIIKRLREGQSQALAFAGGNRAKVTEWETAISGSPDIVNMLNATAAQQAQAQTLLTLTQEQESETIKATEALRELSLRWDDFVNRAVASLAPKATGLLSAFENKGFWGGVDWIGAHSYIPGLVNWAGEHSFLPSAHSINQGISEVVHGDLLNNQTKEAMHIAAQLRGYGWDDAHIQGALSRLKIESGFNPSATGDNGAAYGLAQWHPDRQREFEAFIGHGIRGSTLAEQVAFMNYELTKGHERKAGEKFFAAKGAAAANDAFTRDYERPASVTNNVNVNVESTADADEVGRRVADHFQRVINVTYPTKNLGGY